MAARGTPHNDGLSEFRKAQQCDFPVHWVRGDSVRVWGGEFPGSFQQIKGSYDDYFHSNLIHKSQNVSKYLFGSVWILSDGEASDKIWSHSVGLICVPLAALVVARFGDNWPHAKHHKKIWKENPQWCSLRFTKKNKERLAHTSGFAEQ